MALVLLFQISTPALAAGGDSITKTVDEERIEYTYHPNGSITVRVMPIPSAPVKSDPTGFQCTEQGFTGKYDRLKVEATGVYSDGSILVSVATEEFSVGFYVLCKRNHPIKGFLLDNTVYTADEQNSEVAVRENPANDPVGISIALLVA